MSIPESVADFFPSVGMNGRKYPDQYFDVRVNDHAGEARLVSYRIWQRPPGSDTGHADWRINVKHDTIDLTTEGGGDILLIERLPENESPRYESWLVRATDPEYADLLAHCDREVQASGSAGTKRYGTF